MTRKCPFVGIVAVLVLTACSPSDTTSRPSTTPILPPNKPATTERLATTSPTESASSPPAEDSTEISSRTSGQSSSSLTPTTTAESSGGFNHGISQGQFKVSIPDAIQGSERVDASAAVQLVIDSIVLKDIMAHDFEDVSHDSFLESHYVNQALAIAQAAIERGRSSGLRQDGWTGADLRVESSSGQVTIIGACLDKSEIVVFNSSGTAFPPVAGQNATFSVAPYDVGARISVLEYDNSEFVECEF